jgi:7-keto-8-aminopelargonate synthetase-like enzyme
MSYVDDRIVYVAGLSKAYSSHAAFITCLDERMKAELRAASSLVFSGPVPVATLASALKGLEINQRQGDSIRARILELSRRLIDGARELGFVVDNTSLFPAAFVVVGGMDAAVQACRLVWEHDILITPGIFPAVPKDRCGLRFAVTALNTDGQIDVALEALARVRDEIGSGPVA